MIIIKNQTEFQLTEPSIVTIGKFDGVHLGHQRLLNEMKQMARQTGWRTVIFTFGSFPGNLIQKKREALLMTDEEKEHFLDGYEVDYLIEYPFNEAVRSMEAQTFMEKILRGQLQAAHMVVGTDFHFGRNRSGDAYVLKQYMEQSGCRVTIVQKEVDSVSGQEISSTLVRQAVKEGDIPMANRLMGHTYSFWGEVVHGRGLAHKLGFPTMNIEIPGDKLVPPYGVYSASTVLGGVEYQGILNIGCKPTITDEKKILLELFLFHYQEDTYGKKLQICLHRFVRPEKKFSSVEALREQVLQDARLVQQERKERT